MTPKWWWVPSALVVCGIPLVFLADGPFSLTASIIATACGLAALAFGAARIRRGKRIERRVPLMLARKPGQWLLLVVAGITLANAGATVWDAAHTHWRTAASGALLTVVMTVLALDVLDEHRQKRAAHQRWLAHSKSWRR
jgi:drug/metabolite transporter (DMT)-like permease